MRFFILGNINAGKSTFAKKIQLYLKSKGLEYPILSIDDFRKKYGNGSKKSENIAQNKFYLSINKTQNAIIEMVGFGDIATNIIESLDKNSCIIIYIESPLNICLKRLKTKKKMLESIPYPESINNIEKTIHNLNAYFTRGKLQEKWKKVYLIFYKINTMDNLSDFIKRLPLEHYHYLSEVIHILKSNNYKKLVSFGGLGRCDINIFSDLDLILITKKKISQVYELLKNFFEKMKYFKIYALDEKIIINIHSHIVIEIAVVHNFCEYIQFYHGSSITNISKSILLGNEKLDKEIKHLIINYKPNVINRDICEKKINYYVELLQKAYLANDDFRFYFMNNLIVNQVVRVLCLKENITEFLYCPKNINTLVKKYNIKTILWDMITDKQKHIDKLFNFLKNIGLRDYK
ncbi:hypothetical protein [Helicobacter macacae]|uniref:Polymerase nucleotidyl transferase domain-containing protein n=1 Tax=Helicobacter macacae MIT 99-5501 TaxID=1357400 RepID=V8CAQ0_9HELI|nr:hypothetical protein [Helicobacter macacae]ETD24182.1 hypothetical protein HMPREF2086_00931 [Helicobacter macacae MIT 99-5501]